MLIKCPNCGASSSLDALLSNNAASEAIMALAKTTPHGELLIRYIGLFRPAKSQLTWKRVATLINELAPMMAAQRIERDGQVYDAPPHVWQIALEKMLTLRGQGKITTPLGGHGYLLDIIKTEAQRAAPPASLIVEPNEKVNAMHKPVSATASAVNALQNLKEQL